MPLDDSGGVGEVLSPGENEDDPVETGPDLPVQAETDAEGRYAVRLKDVFEIEKLRASGGRSRGRGWCCHATGS